MKTTPCLYYDSGENVKINDKVYLVDMGTLPWIKRVTIMNCGKEVDGRTTIKIGRGTEITINDHEPDWYLFFADEKNAIKFVKDIIKHFKQNAMDSITTLYKTMLNEVKIGQDLSDIYDKYDNEDRIDIKISYYAEDGSLVSKMKASSAYHAAHLYYYPYNYLVATDND